MVNRKGSKYFSNKRLIKNINPEDYIYNPGPNCDFIYGDEKSLPAVFIDSMGKYVKTYDGIKTYDNEEETDCRPTNKNKKKLKKCKEIDNAQDNINTDKKFMSKFTAKYLIKEEQKTELEKEDKKNFDQIRNKKWHKEYQINKNVCSLTKNEECKLVHSLF